MSLTISSIESAQSFEALLALLDEHLSIPFTKASRKKKNSRTRANELAVKILERTKNNPEQVTQEEKDLLREYTGLGGIGGSANEYYTPKWVTDATWDAIKQYGFDGGTVLEPSAGIGAFSESKPSNALMTSVEISDTSAAINSILHPDDHVINSGFEEVAKDANVGGFDLVTGNPPYGDRPNTSNDKQYKKIKKHEQYFVLRSNRQGQRRRNYCAGVTAKYL